MPPTLTVFEDIPSFHRGALFEELQSQIDTQIYYLGKNRSERLTWETDPEIKRISAAGSHLRGFNLSLPFGYKNNRIITDPKTFGARGSKAALISNYVNVADWQVLTTLKLLRIPIIFLYGSHEATHIFSNRSMVGKARRTFLNRVDAFVTYGTKAAESLSTMGISSNKIITGCNVTNKDFFSETRKEEGTRSDPFRWLYVGQLIERKGLDIFLNCVPHDVGDKKWSLDIIGDGPQEPELRQIVARRGLEENVRFLGGQKFEDIRDAYLNADGLVFLSREEVWGLVVNEALHSGCPVLASTAAGATPDLIQQGVNGLMMSPFDEEHVSASIRLFMDKPWNPDQVRDSADWATPKFQATKIIDAMNVVRR
jgi:glycosyltransferase involved in cell wall biosynthesis